MQKNLLNGKPNTQLNRVILAESKEPLTLKQIQQNIKKEFGIYDQETSISARIREASECGYEKTRIRVINSKTKRAHYLYQLRKKGGEA